MKFYRAFSFGLMMAFLIVGFIFLFYPDQLLVFFNNLSRPLNMREGPEQGVDFFLVLAVAYMYLVAFLAMMMYRYPRNILFPLLLANGKTASALISIYLFLAHGPFLIYLTGFVVDTLIALAVWLFYNRIKKAA